MVPSPTVGPWVLSMYPWDRGALYPWEKWDPAHGTHVKSVPMANLLKEYPYWDSNQDLQIAGPAPITPQ